MDCMSHLQGDAIAFVLGGMSKGKQSNLIQNIHDSLQGLPRPTALVLKLLWLQLPPFQLHLGLNVVRHAGSVVPHASADCTK